jgi:hypothetical protein
MPVSLASSASSKIKDVLFPIASTKLIWPDSPAFYNIPQTYQDLRVIINGRESRDLTRGLFFGFNGLAVAGTYSQTSIYSDGGAGLSSSRVTSTNQFGAIAYMPINSDEQSVYATMTIEILNYSNTTSFKTALVDSYYTAPSTSGVIMKSVGLWQNTAGVNQLDFRNIFQPGTTIDVYGIGTKNP